MKYALLALMWLNSVSFAHAGLLFVTNNDDRVFKVDVESFETHLVGSLGVDFRWSGLAYDPAREILYGISGRGDYGDLYRINLRTGAATSVGTHGIGELFGLAFDSSTDTLYATQAFGTPNFPSLYAIDPDTAEASLIGPLNLQFGIDGLAYDSNRDQLVGTQGYGGFSLLQIDRSSGEATSSAQDEFGPLVGLAYDSDRDIYWGNDIGGTLYHVDPNEGYSLTYYFDEIDLAEFGSEPSGLTYIPTHPEYSSTRAPNPLSFSATTVDVSGPTGKLRIRNRGDQLSVLEGTCELIGPGSALSLVGGTFAVAGDDPPHNVSVACSADTAGHFSATLRCSHNADNVASPRDYPVNCVVEARQNINAGMNDAWVSEGAPFQGMFITAFPELNLIFLAWFTFESEAGLENSAVFGASDQRWVTALGPISGPTAELQAELTSGGRFNSAEPLAEQVDQYGTIRLTFESCNSGTVEYEFQSAGLEGTINIERALESNVALCEDLGSE